MQDERPAIYPSGRVVIAGLSMQPPPYSSGLFLERNMQRHSRIIFWRNQRSKRVTGEKERVSTEVLLQANRWCLHLLKRQQEGPKKTQENKDEPLCQVGFWVVLCLVKQKKLSLSVIIKSNI